MNDILHPPTERDMPPGRAARMRAELLTSIRRPTARHTARRRLAVVAAVVAAAAGTTATALHVNTGDTETLAMASSEVTPSLREAATRCLTMSADMSPDAQRSVGPVAMNDLTVAAERDDQTAILFLTAGGYLACDSSTPAFGEPSGAAALNPWQSRDWLPGPVQRLLLTSTDDDGGDVTVIGRVSDQVHRLVLDYGDKHTTTARLARGVFGLISDGHTVKSNAELVSYNANGTEIGRRPLFPPSDQPDDDQCYTSPTGAIVYGKAGPNCLPAQSWTR